MRVAWQWRHNLPKPVELKKLCDAQTMNSSFNPAASIVLSERSRTSYQNQRTGTRCDGGVEHERPMRILPSIITAAIPGMFPTVMPSKTLSPTDPLGRSIKIISAGRPSSTIPCFKSRRLATFPLPQHQAYSAGSPPKLAKSVTIRSIPLG